MFYVIKEVDDNVSHTKAKENQRNLRCVLKFAFAVKVCYAY